MIKNKKRVRVKKEKSCTLLKIRMLIFYSIIIEKKDVFKHVVELNYMSFNSPKIFFKRELFRPVIISWTW